MKIYSSDQIGEKKYSTRKIIGGFLVVLSVVTFATFAQSKNQSPVAPEKVLAATTTSTVVLNPLIYDAASAQGWRNFLNGRVAWAQAQTDQPAYVLTAAQYAQNKFENYLLAEGYTQVWGGTITQPQTGSGKGPW